MAEYIERDKLYKHFEKSVTIHEATINGSTYPVYLTDHVLHEIRNAPAADVVEVKHGEWIKKYPQYEKDGIYYCSCCRMDIDIATGYETPIDHGIYFCPNCGADMRGGNNGKL